MELVRLLWHSICKLTGEQGEGRRYLKNQSLSLRHSTLLGDNKEKVLTESAGTNLRMCWKPGGMRRTLNNEISISVWDLGVCPKQDKTV